VKDLEKELEFFGTGTTAITEEPDNQGKRKIHNNI
jgi:hypothetical protein